MAQTSTLWRWMEPEADEPPPAEALREEIEDVRGDELRVNDHIVFARGRHIIRSIDRKSGDTWWLTTARVEAGFMREEIDLPITPANSYQRVSRAMSAPTSSTDGERAEYLQPRQRFEHEGQVLQAETVFVSYKVPVEIIARPVKGGAVCRLRVPADKLLQVVR